MYKCWYDFIQNDVIVDAVIQLDICGLISEKLQKNTA
jgi:hypothetical protein